MILGLDHVQVAAPPGCEAEARRFYGELLGLREIAKPAALAARGGVWFEAGDQQLHVGVANAFEPARKAHPGLLVSGNGLNELGERLAAAGTRVEWDESLPGVRRFYTDDPFGNRLELMAEADSVDLLAEQRRYYDAVAPEYEDHGIAGAWGGELAAALDSFRPAGDVLELACGPGGWTRRLLRRADSVLAIDGSPEMLALASARIQDERVRFERADIFGWRPERRYDVVFFGFWLSHVPAERFEQFWSLVADCLRPGGRVFFVDDAHRSEDELVYGRDSEVVRRRLGDRGAYRVVKVPHEPAELERRLRELGWDITVKSVGEPFYWGAGSRAARSRPAD